MWSRARTLWHEIFTKANTWELFFEIRGELALKISGKEERLFQAITREIRKFSKMIVSKYFLVRNNFIPEGIVQIPLLCGGGVSHLKRAHVRASGRQFGDVEALKSPCRAIGAIAEIPPGTKPINNLPEFSLPVLVRMRIQVQHVFSLKCSPPECFFKMLGQEFLQNLALYSRECEYRPRMHSRQRWFPKNVCLHALGLCRG